MASETSVTLTHRYISTEILSQWKEVLVENEMQSKSVPQVDCRNTDSEIDISSKFLILVRFQGSPSFITSSSME